MMRGRRALTRFGLGCAVALCALLPEAAGAATAPVTIPFKLEDHNIVVKLQFKPKQRLQFAFDSGLSSGNLITPGVASALGIQADRDMGVSDAVGERRGARLATVPQVRIGPLTLDQVPFAITDIPQKVIRRPGGGALAGFVGAPLLNNAVLCIDYRHRRLLHWDSAAFDGAGLASAPLQLNHGLPTVDIDIDGRRATLIVDSGAAFALTVYASFAEANDFASRYQPLGTQGGNGGNGGDFQAVITRAQRVELGPGAAFADVPMQVIPQGLNPAWGIDGAIGFELLREMEPCLDTAGGRLLYKGQ